ncbi:MAG: MaoC family dehydratase N-terminal domain-containing protein [Anaerolineae bacterium]|nr:MaoC family dehydratase N-terminal domain-containing protein [Anaerolineae bacterium]
MDQERQGSSFESFAVGQAFTTAGRTITEAEIVAFAGLSGDYNPLHTDATYAAQGPYGRRVAHGLLILSVATGLVARLGWFERSVLAFRELRCKFRKPVFAGDTVRVRIEVVRTRVLARVEAGMVELDVRVSNQDDELVLSSEWSVLMRSGGEG